MFDAHLKANQATLLHRSLAIASDSSSFHDALQRCVSAVCDFTGWPVGHVYIPQTTSEGVILTSSKIWRLSDANRFRSLRETTEATDFRRGEELPGRVFETGEAAWIRNVYDDEEFPRATRCSDLGVKGAFAFPISANGSIVAVLEFFTESEAQVDGDFLALMQDVGAQAGQVLDRWEQADRLRKGEERLNLALDAGGIGTWTWSVSRDFISADDRLGPLFGLGVGEFPTTLNGFLSLVHPEDRERLQTEIRESIDRATVYNTEYRVVAPSGEFRLLGARGLPIQRGGATIGMTGVCWDLTDRWTTEEDLRRSQAQTDAINRELSCINRAHEPLYRSISVEAIADVMTSLLVDEFGADFARFWFRRPGDICGECAHVDHCRDKTACLHLMSSKGRYTHIDGDHRRVPVGAFKIGLIARDGTPTISNDVANDNRVHDRDWARGCGLRSFAGFPIIIEDEVVGVLAMFSKHRIEDHVIDTLSILSKLGAISIHKLQQIEALREQNNRIADYAERLNKKQEAAVAANEELAQRNADLDEFTYVASHDLQEPLRKLISFSTLLEKDIKTDLNEIASRDLYYIRDSAERMTRLIRDLLSLSRAGRSALKHDPVSLDDCVDRAIDSLSTRIAELRPQLDRIDLPTVTGDQTLLTQLYQNLIGNALKFSQKDRPLKLQITAERSNGDWTLGVADNGVGIADQYAEQIFSPFKRLHGRDEFEGSGIGLAICRKAVERHGGKIWVESEQGKGSHFKFTLKAENSVNNQGPI